MTGFSECVEKGLLRKVVPSRTKALESLEKAKELLGEANANLEDGRPNSTVVMAYAAMFDAARAVLFRDGYREKSHYCVARYLEEKYEKKIGRDLINLLDEYRDSRHKVLYRADYYPTTDEAREIVGFATKFIEKIDKIL